MEQMIYEILHPFGSLRNYRGFHQLMIAVKIILEKPSRLEHVTSLYRDIAGQCDCNYYTVERNLRTLIHCMWKRNPEYMMILAKSSLSRSPTVSQFLDIITFHMQKSYPDTDKPELSR